MVQEQWFLDAIRDAPDYLFVSASLSAMQVKLIISVLVGHMPVLGTDGEFGRLIDVIRKYHPEVPVFVFGECSC